MTFPNFLCPKRCEKIFGVGRPEVPENEKVMLRDAGEVQSDPPYQIHSVLCVVMCETCIKRKI